MYHKIIFLIVVFMSGGAEAFDAKNASLFCSTEFSAGLSYNSVNKRWQAATFRPSAKFILKLKFQGSRVRKDILNKDEAVNDYEVTITPAGTNSTVPCYSASNDRRGLISFGEIDNYFDCVAVLQQYSFNMKNNRFLEAYLFGYVTGEDNNDDTPSVAGGTCTRID